ncbi:MAG: hypothetical protein H6618_09505 [Deltaproteobacteria bacterium]|nr:hypothetical protein [Deltaproteobacteria bacterium]
MIQVNFDVKDVKLFIKDLEKGMKKATQHAMNEALTAAHKEGGKIMKKERRMKLSGTDRNSYASLTEKVKYRTRTPEFGTAGIRSSTKSRSFIHLVTSDKTPENQRGKTLKQRRKIRVRVSQGGPVISDEKFFIAKTKSKSGKDNFHVFKRMNNEEGKEVMKKQAAPGVHETLSQDNHQKKMRTEAEIAFNNRHEKMFEKYYEKAVIKHSD